MHTQSAKLTFHIPHAASLKDKRQVCRSLIDKTRRRFNAAVSEVGTQDILPDPHSSGSPSYRATTPTQQSLDEIVRFMEAHAETELVGVEVE